MRAASRRGSLSASRLVGMCSGESSSSLKVRLPWSRSRTTSSVHLSPTRSRVQPIAQRERRGGPGGVRFMLSVTLAHVTCPLPVSTSVSCRTQFSPMLFGRRRFAARFGDRGQRGWAASGLMPAFVGEVSTAPMAQLASRSDPHVPVPAMPMLQIIMFRRRATHVRHGKITTASVGTARST